jgi:hypothetical protein
MLSPAARAWLNVGCLHPNPRVAEVRQPWALIRNPFRVVAAHPFWGCLSQRRPSRDFTPRIAPAIIRFTAAKESPPSSVAGMVANPIADAFG